LQEGQIQSQGDLIKLRDTQLDNRINLHLALGVASTVRRLQHFRLRQPRRNLRPKQASLSPLMRKRIDLAQPKGVRF
jgi:hypothetical protein